MRKHGTTLALALVMTSLAGPMVQAQVPPPGGVNPSRRPVFSPYLNLLRNDNDPAINYFGLVRPQVDFRRALNQVEQDEGSLEARQQQMLSGTTAPVLPATGHASGFLTQRKYFMNRGVVGGTQPITRNPAGAGRTASGIALGASGFGGGR